MEGWSAVIVGVGTLGSALAHYGGFKERGFGVVALFDDDPKKINKQIAGLVVKPSSELKEVCDKYSVAIGIIATPGPRPPPRLVSYLPSTKPSNPGRIMRS